MRVVAHLRRERVVAHDFAYASFLESRMSNLQVVLTGKCADQRRRAWTTCYSNQRCPDDAICRDGNFDLWDVDQVFFVDGECTMLMHFPKAVRSRWFKKSTDVCPLVRNGMDPGPHNGGGPSGVGKAQSVNASSIALRLSLLRQLSA